MKAREVFKHAVGMITDVIVIAFNATGLTPTISTGSCRIRPTSESFDASAHKLHIAPQKVRTDRRSVTAIPRSLEFPLALSVAVNDGPVKKGDVVLLKPWAALTGVRIVALVGVFKTFPGFESL